MSTKSFLGLCIATAIAVILAAVAILGQPRFETSDPEKVLLFPNLVTDLERLKSVVIRHNGQTQSFDWDGKIWTSRDKSGYFASREKLTGMLVTLAQMTRIEGKTKLPDRYARLEVDEPGKGAHGRQVTLIDTAGKEIANVVLGKRQYNMGSQSSNTYIRLPGDPQVWLASGEFSPDTALVDWLERTIININPPLIKSVTVTHPNGERVVVGRAEPEAAEMTVLNLPRGARQVTPTAGEEYGRILTDMNLEDVAPAAEIAFPKDKTTTAVVEGLTGYQIIIELADVDGQEWIKIKGAPPSGGPSKPGDSGLIDLSTDWDQIINSLNARTNGWVFQVPSYQLSILKTRMSGLADK
jgi:hypothetical protein